MPWFRVADCFDVFARCFVVSGRVVMESFRGVQSMSEERLAESQDGMKKMARLLTDMGPPVMEWMAPKAGERILDLGCGSGVWAKTMADMGCDVVGIDVNAQAVEATKARGVEAYRMNAEAMTFDREFDGVFSNAALHWMRHPGRVVAGVVRALKSGGRFVGECGEKNNVKTVVDAVTVALEKRGIEVDNLHPWVFLTKADLTALFNANGLTVRSMEVIGRPTVLPGSLAQWLSVFASHYLSSLHPQEREAFVDEVTQLCRPVLFKNGQWTADYVRLRFYAVKP